MLEELGLECHPYSRSGHVNVQIYFSAGSHQSQGREGKWRTGVIYSVQLLILVRINDGKFYMYCRIIFLEQSTHPPTKNVQTPGKSPAIWPLVHQLLVSNQHKN